ncbi:hypothetical protein [Paenibacillus taiwanensis]|uniref:hypothetical protein n=1 Tax=Paenibacillus taiwanensis TaxID=401638 RepID=UPI000400A4FB|nr:hypothetical protein [Paenibacillus taiwanensis]
MPVQAHAAGLGAFLRHGLRRVLAACYRSHPGFAWAGAFLRRDFAWARRSALLGTHAHRYAR